MTKIGFIKAEFEFEYDENLDENQNYLKFFNELSELTVNYSKTVLGFYCPKKWMTITEHKANYE